MLEARTLPRSEALRDEAVGKIKRKADDRGGRLKDEAEAKIELAKLAGEWLYCERMKVSGFNLPCGQRVECWYGLQPCEMVIKLGLSKPKNFDIMMPL